MSAQPDDNVRKESSKQEANTPLLQEYGLWHLHNQMTTSEKNQARRSRSTWYPAAFFMHVASP